MSKITIALVTTLLAVPTGLATTGQRRFSIIDPLQPLETQVIATGDTDDASLSFVDVPERDGLLAKVQTIAADGVTLFDDAITQSFSGIPVVVTPPVPSMYDAPATLSVLVEAA